MGPFFATMFDHEEVSMHVSILITSLGILFAHRILCSSLHRIGFSNHIPHIFLISAGLMILFFVFRPFHPAQLWFSFGLFLILINFLPHFFSQFLEKQIGRHSLRIVDQLLLGVQSGHSLRSSLHAMAAGESSLLRIPLQNLVHAIAVESSSSGLSSAKLRVLFEELSRIERSQSKCGEQLKAFRRHLKTLEDFRRRSGQISLQIRMQAVVSAVLYVALLAFIVTQFGFFQHRGLILISAMLFLSGLVTVFVIGKRAKWNT
jgi:phosphatidylserine synthase